MTGRLADSPRVPKPTAWLALRFEAAEVYDLVHAHWKVGPTYTFPTSSITENLRTLTEPEHQAPFLLRRLQALYHVTTPKVLVDNAQGKAIALDLSRLLKEMAEAAVHDKETASRLLQFAWTVTRAAAELNHPDHTNEPCVFE